MEINIEEMIQKSIDKAMLQLMKNANSTPPLRSFNFDQTRELIGVGKPNMLLYIEEGLIKGINTGGCGWQFDEEEITRFKREYRGCLLRNREEIRQAKLEHDRKKEKKNGSKD